MAGELDDISVSIGEQREGIKALNRTFSQHCIDDDTRHQENIEQLRALNSNYTKLNETLAPLVQNVAYMLPIVQGYQASRLKAAGALALASTILVGFGWLVTSLAGEAFKWIAAHVR